MDLKDKVADECFDFIEETLKNSDSILVHSVRGQSRACTILATYVMRKYRWSLLKSLEFLNSRRPDLEIRANFVQQLASYENRLQNKGLGPQTTKWTEVSDKTNEFENEELLLKNTFLNAQMGPFADFSVPANKKITTKINWVDLQSNNQVKLATVMGFSFTNMPEDVVIPQKETRNDRISGESASVSLNEKVKEPTLQLSARESIEMSSNQKLTSEQTTKIEALTKPVIEQPKPTIDILSNPIRIKGIKNINKLEEEQIKIKSKATIQALLRPKVNNYVAEPTNPKAEERPLENRQVANIINQNNINNFIIQNPQKVEVITTGMKLSAISHIHENEQAPSIVKKILTAKKANGNQPRCSSASIRRESPKPRVTENNTREHNNRESQKDPSQLREKK